MHGESGRFKTNRYISEGKIAESSSGQPSVDKETKLLRIDLFLEPFFSSDRAIGRSAKSVASDGEGEVWLDRANALA